MNEYEDEDKAMAEYLKANPPVAMDPFDSPDQPIAQETIDVAAEKMGRRRGARVSVVSFTNKAGMERVTILFSRTRALEIAYGGPEGKAFLEEIENAITKKMVKEEAETVG